MPAWDQPLRAEFLFPQRILGSPGSEVNDIHYSCHSEEEFHKMFRYEPAYRKYTCHMDLPTSGWNMSELETFETSQGSRDVTPNANGSVKPRSCALWRIQGAKREEVCAGWLASIIASSTHNLRSSTSVLQHSQLLLPGDRMECHD